MRDELQLLCRQRLDAISNLQALCIADAYPVSEGHSLVIPRRHGADGLELHQPEWNAVVELVHSIQRC